jgi:hypothetical protein
MRGAGSRSSTHATHGVPCLACTGESNCPQLAKNNLIIRQCKWPRREDTPPTASEVANMDIILDEPEHFRRIRTLPLQQIADLGAARRPGPVGRELAVRVSQDVIVVRPFVEDFRRLAGNSRSLESFRAVVVKTMRRRGAGSSARTVRAIKGPQTFSKSRFVPAG